MSDEPKRIITRDTPAHPFSKMNRNASRQETVNAAVNAAQATYDLLSEDHNRIMQALFDDEIEPMKREFKEFREIAARRIREIERRSLSYLVLTAIRVDWLRFQIWLIELRAPVLDRLPDGMAAAIEQQRTAIQNAVDARPKCELCQNTGFAEDGTTCSDGCMPLDLSALGPPEELVSIDADGVITSEPIVAKKAEG